MLLRNEHRHPKCSHAQEARRAQQFVPTHRALQFNFDAPLEELKVRAPHGKIKLSLIPGAGDLDAFAKAQETYVSTHDGRTWRLAERSQEGRPYSQEMGGSDKPEWRPPVSVAKLKGSGQTVASLWSSTWKIEESVLQHILPHASAKALREDLQKVS